MDRDMIVHIGSFLDTPSLVSLSLIDAPTADILRNQLVVATKSDELRDGLMRDDSADRTMQTLRQYLLNPETRQQALIGRTAVLKFARDVADAYQHEREIDLSGKVNVLLKYIKQEFSLLFQDVIKGIMGPRAVGLEGSMMSLMGDGVSDSKWLHSLNDIGLSRLLTAWFENPNPCLAENESLTIKLIQNLPSTGYWLYEPFHAAAATIMSRHGTKAIMDEFAKFLDRVVVHDPNRVDLFHLRPGIIAMQLAEESDWIDDVLFASMLRYLQRHNLVDDSTETFAETRTVLNEWNTSGP